MEWSEIFTKVQEALGLTLADMARQLDVPRDRLNQFKVGRVNGPNYEFLQKFVKTYPSVSLDFLVMGEGDLFRPSLESVTTDETDKDLIIEALTEQVRKYKKQLQESETA